jgi:hypothetical protein
MRVSTVSWCKRATGIPARFRPLCTGANGNPWLRFGAIVLVCTSQRSSRISFADGPAAASYALLALVPFLRGFAHLDLRRAERVQRYGRMAVVEAGATLAMAASILPAAALLGDHRAMIAVLIAHALANAVLSHTIATRAYRLRFSRAALVRIWRFGAPLILNAVCSCSPLSTPTA